MGKPRASRIRGDHPKTDMRALDQKDVVRLLRSEVNRAGGQKKWAKQNGVAPSAISMVLTGDRPPNKKILSKRDRDNFLTAPILWRRCPWTESAVAAGLLVEFAQ